MKDEEGARHELELSQFWRIQKTREAALSRGGPHDPVFLEMRDELEVLRLHSRWPELHAKIDREMARGAELRKQAVFA